MNDRGSLALRVVTINAHDLQIFSRHTVRMITIGELLARLDPDLVGLQEAFVEADRDKLLERLHGTRLRHHAYFKSGMLGSGLLTISAHPVEETSFWRYTKNGKWYKPWHGDWYAGKGVALTRILLPGSQGRIDFYNTHAVARYNDGTDEYQRDRQAQMQELATFVCSKTAGRSPAIVVGDMNCPPGSHELEQAVERAKLQRLVTADTNIDHIFGVEDPRLKFVVDSSESIGELVSENGARDRFSDHDCLVSTIQIEASGGSS